MTDLTRLTARLSRTCRAALERAAERCLRETHFAVEVEHLFAELAGDGESDFAAALTLYDIDAAALIGALAHRIAAFPTGNVHNPGIAAPLANALERAWLIASIDLDAGVIGSAVVLRAVVEAPGLEAGLTAPGSPLARITPARLAQDLPGLTARGRESTGAPRASAGLGATATTALAAYTDDLTARARAGWLDPVIGREAEIGQLIEVLLRRRQNNPILTGDPGVGKTAIVEGLAQRIAAGAVPPPLADVALHTLDLGRLEAGAAARGEYEARLNAVIDEIYDSPVSIILFIDEAHMLAGASGGPGDAANLLKPALARGDLRTIAATTWSEYKRYFEKDGALARRFQPVKVDEPSVATTTDILRALAPKLEAFHDVTITEPALSGAAALSHRYIISRQLPDKAISVLDTACARVAIAQTVRPLALEAADLRCAGLEAQLARAADSERQEQLRHECAAVCDARDAIANQWQRERHAVDRLRALRTGAAAEEGCAIELQQLQRELEDVQRGGRLVPAAVDGQAVAEVIASWTGVPAGAMLGNDAVTARDLRRLLGERIVGQDAALDSIVRRVQTYYADLGDPGKPTGVFLLCGPSGSGKTETARALADLLFGGGRALISVNMSEYQEAHSVSGLKGAPPGYVGYGRGGVLTEAVRRQPYAVVLLDEVEKAHPDVLEIFYQIFDRGRLEDSEGITVDFTNTLILLTSNLGPDALQARFAAAFLARLEVVPYRSLGPDEIAAIVRLKLGQLQERFALNRRGELSYDEALVAAIAGHAGGEGGARSVDALIAQHVLPELSARLLASVARGRPVRGAHLALGDDGRLRIAVQA